jgi:hypothetical protein
LSRKGLLDQREGKVIILVQKKDRYLTLEQRLVMNIDTSQPIPYRREDLLLD